MIRKAVTAVLSVLCCIVIAAWGLSSLGPSLEITYFQPAPVFSGVGTRFKDGTVEWFARYRSPPGKRWRQFPPVKVTRWAGFGYSKIGMNIGYVDNRGVPRSGGTTTATLMAPSWSVVLLLGWYPTIAFIRGPLRRWRRHRKGLCTQCGYDLTDNVSGTCPECGTAVSPVTG